MVRDENLEKIDKNLLTIVPQSIDDLVYIIGETRNEMGGSEFAKVFKLKNYPVSKVYKENAKNYFLKNK